MSQFLLNEANIAVVGEQVGHLHKAVYGPSCSCHAWFTRVTAGSDVTAGIMAASRLAGL